MQTWDQVLADEKRKPYFVALTDKVSAARRAGMTVFPPESDTFNALTMTPLHDVKVVILGQDPYHGEGQAHGLSFSVPAGVKPPPSLVNIKKEIAADLGIQMSGSGDLSAWAKQGVLLLNATLTVEKGLAGSHQKRGWEQFTDTAITALNARREHLVFILWGSYAQQKGINIDSHRHLVLSSVHPSPLSAHRGFFGNHLFSQTNAYLVKHHQAAIDWRL